MAQRKPGSRRDEYFTVHPGDARHLAKLLGQRSSGSDPLLSCTITSPPYADLKNYGHVDQIGWGQSYDEYLVEMRRVFRALHQHTRPDGSLWLIADTLRADGETGRDLPRLEPLPFTLASEAAEAGWILRETIIWRKDKTLPWSTGARLRNAFEYVLLLVKSADYRFHVDRLRDPVELEEWWVKWPERYNRYGKVPSNVWDIPIPVQGSWKTPTVQHACPLPPELIERLVYLSTDPGDVVFDPFAGTGAVVAEAERLGRRGLGIELNNSYVKAFSQSVRSEVLSRGSHDELTERIERGAHLAKTIPQLRALKYAKLLIQRLNQITDLPRVRLVVVKVGKVGELTMLDPRHPLAVELLFVAEAAIDKLDQLQQAAKALTDRQPVSKFGISPTITTCRPRDIARNVSGKRLFRYERGRTWDSAGTVLVSDLKALAATVWPVNKGQHAYPPIVANVNVHEDPGGS